MNQETAFIHQALPIWVDCWARARQLPVPIQLPRRVLQVDVGWPDQLVRYVMPGDDLSVVEKYARELHAPATWLKICAGRDAVAPILPPRWELSAPRFFMHTEISERYALQVPRGYSLGMTQQGQTMHATVKTADGQLAADGGLILAGRYAIFDTIITETQHQRKGLGRLVMQALANHAYDNAAHEGSLVATEAGQMLYDTLGWKTVSPYTSAYIAPI